jgi:hypothetical protein
LNASNNYYKHNKKKTENENKQHNRGTRINTAVDITTILENIKQSPYGEHDLLVYFSHEEFEEIFTEACKDAIINKNEIFLLVAYYQDLTYLRKKLRLAGIDVTKYENNGTLVIMDSETAYQIHTVKSENNSSYNNIINAREEDKNNNNYNITMTASQLARHAEKIGKNGVTIVGDVGPFILSNRIQELISYEQSISAKLKNTANVRLICCYHKKDFRKLSEEQQQKILAAHTDSFVITM